MTSKLKKHLLIYIIGFIISSFIVCWGISIVCKPKENEKISFFISCPSYNETKLKQAVFDISKDKGIREINCYYSHPDDQYTYKYFDSVHESVDFYLVSESYFYVSSYFGLSFSKEQIEPFYPNINNTYLYSKNERGTGIVIYDNELSINIGKDYFSYSNSQKEVKYYLILPKTSVHTGILNNQQSSLCFDILNTIFL